MHVISLLTLLGASVALAQDEAVLETEAPAPEAEAPAPEAEAPAPEAAAPAPEAAAPAPEAAAPAPEAAAPAPEEENAPPEAEGAAPAVEPPAPEVEAALQAMESAPAVEPPAPEVEAALQAMESAPEPTAQPSEPRVIPTRRYDDGRVWRNGMPLLWVYSCGMGSMMGAALGGIASDGDLAAAGMYAGGGAGALGMVFLGPDEISLDQSMLISSSGLLGTWSGSMLAATLIPEGAEAEENRIIASAVLGAAAGTAVGGLMKRPPPARNMLMVDISTFAGWQVGGGIGDLMELDYSDDRNLRSGISLLGGGAFLAGSAAAARHGMDPSPGVMGMTIGHASWIGLWTPWLITDNPEPQQVLGGMRLGLGAGTVAGLALSPHIDLTPKSVGLQLAGAGAGAAVGAGVPMALGIEGPVRGVVGPMLLGGVGGQALGAAVAPSYDISPSDALLMGTIETWALYQGLGWAVFIDQANPGLDERQSIGMGLSIAGTGTLVAGAMGPLTEFTMSESAMVGSGGAWGTWYGAWGGQLAGLDPQTHWLTTLVAGNVGLLGTAAAAGGGWDPDWRTVGVVDSLGLLGGAVGAMAGVIASPDLEAVAAGSLLGSTAGIVGGALVTRNSSGPGWSPGWGPIIPRPHLNLPYRARVSAAPWLAESGDPGAMVSLSLHER